CLVEPDEAVVTNTAAYFGRPLAPGTVADLLGEVPLPRRAPHREPRARPTIGHHLPEEPASWPGSPAELRAAYPDSAEVTVLFHRGSRPALRALGHAEPPPGWVAYDQHRP